MHRAPLIKRLEAYGRRWPEEADVVARFIAFVGSHPDCFQRSLRVGHVTGSAWVASAAGTHVLLTHHRKLDRWLQLGGHADGDGDILRVASREVEEESGLTGFHPVSSAIFDIDIHPIPARGDEPEHFHYDVRFAFQANGSEAFVVSEESHDLAWIAVDDMPSVSSEHSMQRMACKWEIFNSRR